MILKFLLFLGLFSTSSWASCPNEQLFKNLINKEKTLIKGSAHTFSKTNQANFWFWHEKRALLNLDLPSSKEACEYPNLLIKHHLTLKDGILPPGKQPNGSTYLVTYEWAKKAIYYAVMEGESIRIIKD